MSDDPGSEDPAVDPLLVGLTALAVLAGVVLRFAPRSGMWLDEALTVNISSLPVGDIGEALRHDGHPPLFYVLLHLWTSVFGASDWWARALPGVFSTLTLPVTYLAGVRLASRRGAEHLGARRTGMVSLALMAVMPFGIRYGAEVRMYSLVVLLVGVGYLLVDRLWSAGPDATPRTLALPTAGVALVAAALLWTHYWSMWLLAAVGLVALWRAWREGDPARRLGARLSVGALVLGGILFLPWVPSLLYQSAHTGTPWGEKFGPASVVVLTIVDFAGARFGIAQLLSYLLVLLVALGAVAVLDGDRIVLGSRVAPRARNELLLLSLTMGIGWAASYASGNTFSSRYAAVVFPLFVLCIAAGVAVLRGRVATLCVVAAVALAGLWGGTGVVRFERSQTDAIAEAIAEDLSGDALIVVCPDQLGVAMQRQAERLIDADVDVVPYPTAGDPRFVDWVDYGERNAAADPASFVEALRARIDSDTTVYVVANFTYRTFEGHCQGVLNHLSNGRQVVGLVERNDDLHDEVANLWAIRPG